MLIRGFLAVDEVESSPVPVLMFFSELPPEKAPEKVPERLREIFEKSGFRTGADAQMMPRSTSIAAAI